jgi:hypothetical protein
MQQIIWLAIAWVGGIAAILGSLMTIASLILWLIPDSPSSKNAGAVTASTPGSAWVNRLKLTAVAVAIALVGLSLLIAFPFPLQTAP